MNLEQIYRQLYTIRPDLEINYTEFKNQEKPYYYLFRGIESFKHAYSIVREYAPFLISEKLKDALQPIFASNVFIVVQTAKSDGDLVIAAYSALMESVTKYINYLKPLVISESDENSLIVELPSIPDLDELERTIKELKQALMTPVYDLDGRVEVKKVDSGSIIIDLIFIGVLASTIVKTVGNLIWAAVANRNKYIEGNLLVEQVRATKIGNDMAELLKKKLEDDMDNMREAEAQHVLNSLPPEKNNAENLGNYKHSLDMFKLLLDRGAKFNPSINAPEETKALFPDTNLLHLITSKLKLLAEGQEEK